MYRIYQNYVEHFLPYSFILCFFFQIKFAFIESYRFPMEHYEFIVVENEK